MLAMILIISISPGEGGGGGGGEDWTRPNGHYRYIPNMLAISNAVEPLFPRMLTAAPWQPSN